ncbi:MAG: hypothetical protein J6Q69_01645 [Clostridia bacterium]|nr:hypothetical protein [Clostridia bacterium]
MFNYVRNLNSSTPPEVIKRPIGQNTEAFFGELMYMENAELKGGMTKTSPLYLTLEAKAIGDAKGEISCIRVLPGTVLSASIDFSASVKNGDGATFYINDDGRCLSISSDGTDCEVIGTIDDFTALIIVN